MPDQPPPDYAGLTADGFLPTHWRDSRGRHFTCRFDLPLAVRFVREKHLSFEPSRTMRCFHPDELNGAELLDLAFLGTRWNAVAQGDKSEDPDRADGEETFDEFVSAHQEGFARAHATFAARAAILNFSHLRPLPTARRRDEGATLRASENALRALLGIPPSEDGPSPTSGDGASSPGTAASTTAGS